MCRVQIDMSGSGLGGGGGGNAPPSPPVSYRPNIQRGVMDIGAFMTDLDVLSSDAGGSMKGMSARQFWTGIIFVAATVMVHFV